MKTPHTPWEPATAPAIPPPHEVHVYRARVEPDLAPALRSILLPDELARADRLRFERDRARFIYARAGLRQLLGACLGTAPGAVRLQAGPTGKPLLADAQANLQFNLAHAGDLVLYAVARGRQVGVDVEALHPARPHADIAERFFATRERAALAAAPEPARWDLFLSFWTRKEAMVKATGEGIWEAFRHVDTAEPLPPDDPWTRCDLDPDPAYLAALVAEGRGLRVRTFALAVTAPAVGA